MNSDNWWPSCGGSVQYGTFLWKVSVPITPCLEAGLHATLEVPPLPLRPRECRCATAQRAQCADENMGTLEKPDGFASELFLDQLNLLES
jgi:hypothetical protein